MTTASKLAQLARANQNKQEKVYLVKDNKVVFVGSRESAERWMDDNGGTYSVEPYKQDSFKQMEHNNIKHLIKTTNYWLFKKTNEDSDYHYIRSKTDGLDSIVWFIGKENQFCTVSSVGGTLSDELQRQLENEYQDCIKST